MGFPERAGHEPELEVHLRPQGGGGAGDEQVGTFDPHGGALTGRRCEIGNRYLPLLSKGLYVYTVQHSEPVPFGSLPGGG